MLITLLLSLFATNLHAQDSYNPLDGHTPSALQPGTPTGSFPLSGFDNINPFNGNLNFSLPLMKVGGRGGAGDAVQLSIEQKWTVIHSTSQDTWGNTLDFYDPEYNWWTAFKPGYGPGVLIGRYAMAGNQWCQFNGYAMPDESLTRLTFTAPDGTEYELRDQLTGGEPKFFGPCTTSGFNRGRVFITSDGQAATFISDDDIRDSVMFGPDVITPSGYLMLRDGTRYRIDAGTVTWIRDRNGNLISFTYDPYSRVSMITDSLNRQVTFEYDVTDATYGLCDRIHYKGFGGAARTIWVTKNSMGNALRSGFSLQTYHALWPELNNASNYSYHNPTVITGVRLPNGQAYRFYYNSYGEMSRVELPTGGAYEYDYATGLIDGTTSGVIWSYDPAIYRRVIERRVYADGATLESKMTYSRPESSTANLGYVTINQYDAGGTLQTSERHYYYGSPKTSLLQNDPTDYSAWQDGKEYQTELLAVDAATVLRCEVNNWVQRAQVGWYVQWTNVGWHINEPSNDPRIASSTTSLVDTNQVSQKNFSYDQYNNQTDVYEYDYGAGGAGQLLRRTHTDYLTTNPVNGVDYTATNIHLRNLPTQQQVFDAVAGELARTTYEYDNYTLDAYHAVLTDRPSISGLDTAFTSSYTWRGNVTGTTRWVLQTGAQLSSYQQYDIAGNLVKAIDPRSTPTTIYATTFDFTDRYGAPDGEAEMTGGAPELGLKSSYAYVTKVTNAIGTAYAQYDYYLGAPVDAEDMNGVVSSGYYNDTLDRPKQIINAANQAISIKSQTSFDYDDINRIVTTTSDQSSFNDTNPLKSQVIYDGLGRVTEKRQYETGSAYMTIKTIYDAVGRVYQVSNPYRSGDTIVWTTTQYDALGRVFTVTTPDNAVIATAYSGNRVMVTDQGGRQRVSTSNPLGQITDVWEIKGADQWTEAVSFPNHPEVGAGYKTHYGYDALNNLRAVTQETQQRFFMYDSLSRLIRAKNPEQGANPSLALTDPESGNSQWSMKYDYDANGNLTLRVDALNVTTNYTYDALNRNTAVDYLDTVISPDITRGYDGATMGKGRFWYEYAGGDYSNGQTVSHRAIDSYDAMGRALVQRQLFKSNGVWSATYQTQQGYDHAGHVTSMTYPSVHTVNYNYDMAGRLADNNGNLAFTGNLGDGVQRTYSRGISYSAWNTLSQEQFGTNTPVYNKLFYNIRGQLSQIRESTTPNDEFWNRGAIINHYSGQSWAGSGTDNNGNLQRQDVYIPGDDNISSYTRSTFWYDYDSLNRLKSVQEDRDGTWQWGQYYNYDRWGNRTIDFNQTWGNGIPKPQFDAEAATNRLYAPNDPNHLLMKYDAAGNLINDGYTSYGSTNGTPTRTYDEENRTLMAQDINGQTARYTYDASGNRVRRNILNQETWQIYGMSGELLAEYAANASPSSPQKEYGYRNGQLIISAGGSQVGGSPYGGTPASVPGTVEAELFDEGGAEVGYHDTTPGTHGQDYDQPPSYPPPTFRQPTDVDIYHSSSGYSNGYLIVMQAGDWMKYTVDVAATGSYTLTARTWYWGAPGGTFHVEADGVDVTGQLQLPGGSTWQLVTKTGVALSAGRHVLRIVCDTNGSDGTYIGDIDSLSLTAQSGMPQLGGYWHFNEGARTSAADSSGSGNTGTLQGAAWGAGKVGPSSASFDGVDDYVQVGASTSLAMTGAATFSAWIYPTGSGSGGSAGGIIVNKEGEYEIARFGDGTIQWAFANTSPGWAWISTGYVAPLNQWTQVTITYNNGVVKTYANGQLVNTYNGVGSIGDVNSSQNDFRIGGRQCCPTAQNFQGRIDEVRVYSGALSTSDVSMLAGQGVGVQINWIVTDHLGTPRMIMDQTGSLSGVNRHDYLPFGEELYAGVGGRSAQWGYSSNSDSVRQKFTGYERDNETGLDYAKARYFGSSYGRFTSPDPLVTSASPTNPQSWNRYTYCLNNPTVLVDPTGLIWEYQDFTQNGQHLRRYSWVDGKKAEKGWHAVDFNGRASTTITLIDGRTAVLRANFRLAEVFPATPFSPLPRQGGNSPEANRPLLRELARRTAPMPRAMAAFAGVSIGAGTAIGAAPAAGSWAAMHIFGSAGEGSFFTSEAAAAAEEYAAANGGSTISSTLGGQVLRATDGITRAVSPRLNYWLWSNGSRYFAEGVTWGTAHVFLRNPNPMGIWQQVERPVLVQRGIEIIEHTVEP